MRLEFKGPLPIRVPIHQVGVLGVISMCYLKRKFSGDLSLKDQPRSEEKATNTINCPLLGILYFLGNREATGKDELDVAFGDAPGCNIEKKGKESKSMVGRS